MAICLICSGHGYAAHTNNNPASIGFVEEAVALGVEVAVKRSTYTAGTAISILNNVISGAYTAGTGIAISSTGQITATGATEPYQGIGAININGTDVSARFTGSNGIYVPVDANGDNTGTIQGPTGANGITVSSGSPGTISLDTQYAAGAGITFTPDTPSAGTTTISQDPSYSIGDQLEGGTIYYLDATKRHGLMVLRAALTTQASAGFTPGTTGDGNAFANGIGGGMINSQYWLSYFQAQSLGGSFVSTAVGFAFNQDPDTDSNPCPDGEATLCYGGWYLPSIRELRMLYNSNLVTLNCGGATSAWSSTSAPNAGTYPSSTVYSLDFSNAGAVPVAMNLGSLLCVLPIRQF